MDLTARLPAPTRASLSAIQAWLRQIAAPRAELLSERVRTQQIELLFKNVAVGVIGAGLAGLSLEIGLVGSGAVAESKGAAWAGYLLACMAAHLILLGLYKRRNPEAAGWRRWAYAFTLVAFLEGAGWGWASAFLVDAARPDLQLLLACATFVVAAAAVPAFASYLPAFFALFLPASLPFTVVAFIERQSIVHLVMFCTLFYHITVVILALQTSRKFQELVALRIKSADLAEQLHSQIELVEQAMIAKANFLAAASHDLRQPVHAIALFAGALCEMPLPDAARRLTGQIENSVEALDGLFAALLDISRLDANSVEVRNSSVAIAPLCARIVQDFTTQAEAKGIAISYVATAARAYADPVLLERILRNLVSNAVRYTSKGRVLVGCRKRGEAVEIQVCDTGVGIAAAHRDDIFKEYFQLDNPERDRSKGLGLGLAIVQRLVRLLDARLVLRSHPGRGSCFGVILPIARSTPSTASPQPAPSLQESGLVVVVDDEAPVLVGMTVLLQGWGYDVVGAGSGAAAMEALSTRVRRPDLVISDHWLRGGETGFDVIDQLRVEYNDEVPAVLISGDTGPALLAQAQAAGVVLLRKPTPHNKLRAAIAQLIAAGREG